jgi:hypothetical protein
MAEPFFRQIFRKSGVIFRAATSWVLRFLENL